MTTIQEAARWLLSPHGRLISAALLFVSIWAIKSIPRIKQRILSSDRAKLIASIIMAMMPAAIMLLDPTIPAIEAWSSALSVLLGAMGIQGGLKAALGSRLKATVHLGDDDGRG